MDLISIESQEITDKIDQELLAYVPAKPPILNQACKMSLTGGKRIRGLICSCSCLAVGGTMEVAIPLAVSVELAHAFSLVHDDIVDDDAIRRGKPAIHAEFGSKIAVIVGDYIHGTSYRSLHTIFKKKLISFINYIRILEILYQAESDICIGQVMDMYSKLSNSDNPNNCLDIAKKKTGTGFMAAAKIGAIAGGGTDEDISILSNYGMCLGISYQIRDDILDVFGLEEELGKPLFSDLSQAKNTMVLSHLLSNLKKDREILLSLVGNKELDSAEISKLKELFVETGSIEFAQHTSLEYVGRSKKVLNDLAKSKYKNILIEIADYVSKRES